MHNSPIACGHSCIVASSVGMATNGPCHCLDGLPPEQRLRLVQAFQYYREQIKYLKLSDQEKTQYLTEQMQNSLEKIKFQNLVDAGLINSDGSLKK